MRITITAVGKLKAGAERALTERYAERAAQAGRALGFEVQLREVPESRAARDEDRRAAEAAALSSVVAAGSLLVMLDERGESLTSPVFAARLGSWRDRGVGDVAFLIGGADGLAPTLQERAGLILAFGAMTWPHQLVRAMLAEQIYRAVTILAGHPYHRA